MTNQAIRAGFFAAGLLLVTPLAADPVPAPSSGAPVEDAGAALAREAQIVIDAILEHHVDPPTRQEMWLAGARAVLANAGVVQHPGLSAEISRLTAPDDFVVFAKRLCLDGDVRLKSPAALREAFIDGLLEALPGGGRLIPQKELLVQEQFEGNRYIGTGIALTYDQEKKFPQIAQVIPGGPMERAGGRQGDLILRIDNRDAHGLNIQQMIDLLRGDEGTSVTLVVGEAVNNSRTLKVTRGPVVFETIEGVRKADDQRRWDFHIDARSSICCLKVVRINGSTVHDLKKIESQLRNSGAKAVILDLRTVHEGELHHAVLLADALLDGGLIGRVRGQAEDQEFQADRDRVFRDLPVVLLVDRHTGGAGEWVAAAVQDNRAGIVVGEESAGMFQVHSTVTLSAMDSALSLNTGIFERPDKRRVPTGYVPHSRARADTPPPGPKGQVTPDHSLSAGERELMAATLPMPRRPFLPAPDGSPASDPILTLAVKVLKARLNGGQSDGN
jgi:carboxyl-terminal processing protease